MKYPDTKTYIQTEVYNLKKQWEEFIEKAKNTRRMIDLTIEYYQLLDKVSNNRFKGL